MANLLHRPGPRWSAVALAAFAAATLLPPLAARSGAQVPSQLSAADKGFRGSVRATQTINLLTPSAQAGGEVRFKFHSEYEGTVDVGLCRVPRGPISSNGCGLIKPQPPLDASSDLVLSFAFLGRRGNDVTAYADLSESRGLPPSDLAIPLLLPTKNQVIRSNEVSTEPTGASHYGRVKFKIVSDAEITATVLHDAEPGNYALLFQHRPAESIVYHYSASSRFPWWQQGTVPSIRITPKDQPPGATTLKGSPGATPKPEPAGSSLKFMTWNVRLGGKVFEDGDPENWVAGPSVDIGLKPRD